MSYSRWSTSRWYTYWCAQDEKNENRDTSIFTVCGTTSFAAKQIRDDINKCLNIVRKKEDEMCDEEFRVTIDEIQELRKYMRRFLKNVERSYPEG